MAPTLREIEETWAAISPYVIQTPMVSWAHQAAQGLWPENSQVWAKLELMQVTGTFKARGAMANILALSPGAQARGVTAFSAGNHALALGWAAKTLGVTATICVPAAVNPYRLDLCRAMGVDLKLCADIHEAKETCEALVAQGRTLVHPFEGPAVARGTGTLGLEIIQQLPPVQAVVIAVGGGGLAGGIANAIRQARPEVDIYGVEPEGANTMTLSLDAGVPQAIEQVTSIADSLGAPNAEPYSFQLCRDNLDAVVTVSDADMIAAMKLIYATLKLVSEPACAASVAAVKGPLKDRLKGKKVCALLCGSNIGISDFARLTD